MLERPSNKQIGINNKNKGNLKWKLHTTHVTLNLGTQLVQL